MKLPVILTTDGCDRATAYHMSNKVARHPEGVFVTWLDYRYRAILALIEPDTGRVVSSFPLSQGMDNHCGAALAVTPDNRLHLVAGAHASGGFIYRHSDSPSDPASWSLPQSIGPAATYPSLVAGRNGGLALAHRYSGFGSRWAMMIHTRPPGKDWLWPLKLMQAAADNYFYPTNSLAVAPDQSIHLVIEFYKTYPPNTEGSKSVAVTHVYSLDGGINWLHDDGRVVSSVPFGIEDASLLCHDPAGDLRPGNVTALPDGRVAVCVWNSRLGTLALRLRAGAGDWRQFDLTAQATSIRAGWRINSQGRIAVDTDGKLVIVTTIAPNLEWTHAEQHVRCLWFDPKTEKTTRSFLVPKDLEEKRAAWLPSIEQSNVGIPAKPLLLLYTDGNRGDGNVNHERCGVRMLELTANLRD